jgi:hypothetical protein
MNKLQKILISSFVVCMTLHSQTNPEGDVSTLNNQLVKVGEKNEYLHSYKKFNLSLDPIGVIVGLYDISGSYAFHPNLAASLTVGYMYEPYGADVQGFSTTLAMPVYFRKVYSGLFLEPGVSFAAVKETDGPDSATAIGPQMLIGWHWLWDSGLNFALAGGVQRNFTGKDHDSNSDVSNYNKFRAVGYFRAGWNF